MTRDNSICYVVQIVHDVDQEQITTMDVWLLPWMFDYYHGCLKQKDYRHGKKVEVSKKACKNLYSILKRHLKISNTNQENFTLHFSTLQMHLVACMDHKIILRDLKQVAIPKHYTKIIKDAFNCSTFKVHTFAYHCRSSNIMKI